MTADAGGDGDDPHPPGDVDAVERPDGDEHRPDEQVAVRRSPLRRVVRELPVVADHEVGVRRHVHRTERRRLHAGVEVGLREELAVDVDVPVATLDGLPRHPDDPLDEVVHARDVGARRCAEHHDVAACRIAQVVGELVDQHPVVGLEAGHHRLGRDVEGLEREAADEERERDGDDDDDAPLHEVAEAAVVGFTCGGRWLGAHRTRGDGVAPRVVDVHCLHPLTSADRCRDQPAI